MEQPITCTADEANAILSGQQTELRREIDFSRSKHRLGCHRSCFNADGYNVVDTEYHQVVRVQWTAESIARYLVPLVADGSLVWVRETWRVSNEVDSSPASKLFHWTVQYKADNAIRSIGFSAPNGKWRPASHMPPWASRITLRVTGVQVVLNADSQQWEWVISFEIV